MRWSRVGWPAVGYVSFEDVDGYAEHLARLVTDAPPTVAALASITWSEARVSEWRVEDSGRHDTAGVGAEPVRTVHAAFVVRNDEVLDTPDGLWRRWNHARVTMRFDRAVLEPDDTDVLDLLAGDVQVARGELAHVDADVWELRLLLSPTGELAIHFRDVAVEVRRVDEEEWTALEARPAHGWHGPIPDGWVDWATPSVRAAAHGDVGGLSLALDGFDADPADIDGIDPRWGFAPLHAAAWFDRRAVLEALLERGAALGIEDAEGRTALDLARERGSTRAEELLLAAYEAG
ncbi:ankyrin repeat domain-containing protein [Curtobacterium sp. PhB115]|uniref:ankyrin repeat domain-containing protein n=1 Tax=Curtobacterium sp. PhB115 TaxID=2485173 RepID=UPI000FA5749E|nr:ankyrin repeat domain-containing protein [Curtobacterium sp. PhB115]ROP74851.1 ankyrin repeat protein [Curtobacterium sp. PhB115]